MAGGYERAYGSRIVLEGNGGGLGTTIYQIANDSNILTTMDEGYPYLMFFANIDWNGTPPDPPPILLYARARNVIGDNDADPPSDDHLVTYIGGLVQNSTTDPQYCTPPDLIIHRPHFEVSIYIKNNHPAGWSLGRWELYCYPWTYRRIQ